MVCTKVEPAPEMLPVAQSIPLPPDAVVVADEASVEPEELSSEPHAPASSASASSGATKVRGRNVVEVGFTDRTVRGRGSAAAATNRTEGEHLANVGHPAVKVRPMLLLILLIVLVVLAFGGGLGYGGGAYRGPGIGLGTLLLIILLVLLLTGRLT